MEPIKKYNYNNALNPKGDPFSTTEAKVAHLNEIIDQVTYVQSDISTLNSNLNNVSERVDDLENLPQDDYFIIGSFYYDTPQSTTLDNDILPCIVGNHNTPFTNLGNCLNIVSGAATNYAPKLILGTLGGGVGSEIEAYNPITNTNQVITSLNYEISSFRIEQAQALIQSYNPVNKPFLYVNVKDIQYTGTQNTAIASHITNYILDGTAASPYGFNNPQNNSVYYTFEIRFNLLEIQFS